MSDVAVHPVSGRRGLRAFVRVARRLRGAEPCWVAPLEVERRLHLGPGNPYFRHAEAGFFVAWRDGAPVGRISAQLDSLAQPTDGPRVGHFGFLEAADQAVMAALFEAAEAWLRARGAGRVVGPLSLSINDEAGLLVEGFDTPPRMLMNHAPPWYGPAVEACGYAKAKNLIAYRFDMAEPLPTAAVRMAEQAAATEGVAERPLDTRRFHAEIRTIVEIFNDAWADNWGFVPMTDAEVRYMANNMKLLIRPELVRIVERHGEPVAMIVALPDLHEALAGLDGRLLPFGWARLLWRLKVRGVPGARVLLMGVRQAHRGGFLGGALAALLVSRMHAAAAAAGYREVELSWVLEDNRPTRRLIESVGGVRDKTYRVYAKELA